MKQIALPLILSLCIAACTTHAQKDKEIAWSKCKQIEDKDARTKCTKTSLAEAQTEREAFELAKLEQRKIDISDREQELALKQAERTATGEIDYTINTNRPH